MTGSLTESRDDLNRTLPEEDDHQLDFNTIFPVEVKTRILECLPFADLMSASLVCHEWNDIINKSRNLDQVVYQFSTYSQAKVPTNEPFNRNYVNFEIKELPTDEEFHAKFEAIREQVKSIRIYVKDNLSRVKLFLDSFTNLTSLELVHLGYLNNYRTTEDDITALRDGLNLVNLKHVSVRCEFENFADDALMFILEENKLKSLEVEINCHVPRNAMEVPVVPNNQHLMDTIKELLNSQESLKSLKIHTSNVHPFHVSKDDARQFAPKFELEMLSLTGSVISCGLYNRMTRGKNVALFCQKLFSTCIDTCKSLHIDFGIQNIPDIVDALTMMKNLEELSINQWSMLGMGNRDYAAFGHFKTLLKSNVTKSRLKKLTIGKQFVEKWGHSNRWEHNDSDVMEILLSQQVGSLEELNLCGSVICSHTVWKIIGAMPRLRVLQAIQLSKTALSHFNDSQIESLIIMKKSSMANKLIADEGYWEVFRAKNSNFKSIVMQEN